MSVGVVLVFASLSACSTTGSTPLDSGSDASHDAALDQSSTCAPDAAQPYCLWGGPCSCNDVGDAPPVCVGTTWECPDGSTPYDQCQGIPPKPDCGAPTDAGAD